MNLRALFEQSIYTPFLEYAETTTKNTSSSSFDSLTDNPDLLVETIPLARRCALLLNLFNRNQDYFEINFANLYNKRVKLENGDSIKIQRIGVNKKHLESIGISFTFGSFVSFQTPHWNEKTKSYTILCSYEDVQFEPMSDFRNLPTETQQDIWNVLVDLFLVFDNIEITQKRPTFAPTNKYYQAFLPFTTLPKQRDGRQTTLLKKYINPKGQPKKGFEIFVKYMQYLIETQSSPLNEISSALLTRAAQAQEAALDDDFYLTNHDEDYIDRAIKRVDKFKEGAKEARRREIFQKKTTAPDRVKNLEIQKLHEKLEMEIIPEALQKSVDGLLKKLEEMIKQNPKPIENFIHQNKNIITRFKKEVLNQNESNQNISNNQKSTDFENEAIMNNAFMPTHTPLEMLCFEYGRGIYREHYSQKNWLKKEFASENISPLLFLFIIFSIYESDQTIQHFKILDYEDKSIIVHSKNKYYKTKTRIFNSDYKHAKNQNLENVNIYISFRKGKYSWSHQSVQVSVELESELESGKLVKNKDFTKLYTEILETQTERMSLYQKYSSQIITLLKDINPKQKQFISISKDVCSFDWHFNKFYDLEYYIIPLSNYLKNVFKNVSSQKFFDILTTFISQYYSLEAPNYYGKPTIMRFGTNGGSPYFSKLSKMQYDSLVSQKGAQECRGFGKIENVLANWKDCFFPIKY